MLLKGAEFLIVGMSVVFLFLILLVVVLKSMTYMLRKLNLYSPEEQTAESGALPNGQLPEGKLPNGREIAAALAAIKAFSKNQ